MKQSKLLFKNRNIFKRGVLGYDLTWDCYEHEIAFESFSGVWAIDNATGNEEHICYSTNSIDNDGQIKEFLLSKLVSKIKNLFIDFNYDIKALKNGVKVNDKIFKLKTPKMNRYAWLLGSSIKSENFNKLFEIICEYMNNLSSSH